MNALTGGFPNNHQRPHSFNGGLTPFGFPPMMNMNRPMSGNGIDGASFSSSSVSILFYPSSCVDQIIY